MENGEIDLLELYEAFKRTRVYRLLNNSFRLITDNKIWFIAFILTGFIVGYFIEKKKPLTYKSEIIIESKEIDNYVSTNIISTFHVLILGQNVNELEKNDITKELAANIKNIEFIALNIEGEEREDEKQSVFKILLYMHNPNNLEQFETAFINYLNKTKYSAELKAGNLKQFYEEKANLVVEINELDSLKTLFKTQPNQPVIYNEPSAVALEKVKAKIRITELDRRILESDNYTILNSFTFSSPEDPKGKCPLKCALISFLLGFFVLRILKK